jgi:hypothetical protein
MKLRHVVQWVPAVVGAGFVLMLVIVVFTYRSDLADERAQLADAQATLSAVRADDALLHAQAQSAEAGLAGVERDLAAERERAAELRRVSPYPRGAFGWCPSVAGTLPVNQQTTSGAGPVAVAFDLALNHHARRHLARLEDPTIGHDALVPRRDVLDSGYWAMTGLTRGLRVVGGGPGAGDGLAAYGCGRAVAARTWIIGVHDASNTASAGGASFYLVRRPSGWKVWGSY